MTTFDFVIPYSLRSPDLYKISKMSVVASSTHRASDTGKKTLYLSTQYKIGLTNAVTRVFVLRNSINFDFSLKQFSLPFIFNKELLVKTKIFSLKSKIDTVQLLINSFLLRNKIDISDVLRTYNFTSKYVIDPFQLSQRIFLAKYTIVRNQYQDKLFSLPYELSSGDNKYPSVTVNGSTGSISDITYLIDGVTANIGDVSSLLSNTIVIPKIIYIVVNNGAFSVFKTAKFELTEANKTSIQVNTGITFRLQGTNVRLDMSVDKSVPLAIKFIRGD